jgi:PhnB protein
MAKVSTYLNFLREAEEAFIFYKSVFGGEFDGDGIMRFSSAPPDGGMPPLAENEKNLVMHVSLPILGGTHHLMGCDTPESHGFNLVVGTNIYITLTPDSKSETKQLFDSLSKDGKVTMNLQDTFWGSYYGQCTDKFGIQWMFNFENK